MPFNIADLYEIVADHIPDQDALVCGDTRYTYRQLDERANQVAHYLKSLGLGKNDHIGIYMYNCAEYLETYLAALKIRAVPFNVNYRYVADELEYLFNYGDFKALVFHQEYSPIISDVKDKCPTIQHYIAVTDDSGADIGVLDGQIYQGSVDSQPVTRDFDTRDGSDIFIMCTGGTTGMPKGVMWTHEDLFFAALQGGNPGGDPIEAPEEIGPLAKEGESAWCLYPAPPFIHGTAIYSALITFFSGGKVVVTKSKSYQPAEMVDLIQRESIQVLVLVGDAMAIPLIQELEKRGDAADVSSLAVLTSQGAILSPSVYEKLEELVPGAMIMNNFGASETGHQGQAIEDFDDEDGEDDGMHKRTKFFLNEHTAVLDDDFNEVEPGSEIVGKIASRGHIPLGYYKDEQKTAETFFEIDGVRWVIPGDFATVDENGLVTLLGRGSICINSGGEKIYPEEVEEALKAHDGIQDVLVVGVADDRFGQRVAAVVQLKDGISADTESLDAHIRSKVAGYKIPREWHFVDLVQRQPSGKPDYKWARETAESGQFAAG